MAGFVAFLPEVISEGSAMVSGLFHGVEGAVAGQYVFDQVENYAKKNPESSVGKILNPHKAHTQRLGMCNGKKRRRVG